MSGTRSLRAIFFDVDGSPQLLSAWLRLTKPGDARTNRLDDVDRTLERLDALLAERLGGAWQPGRLIRNPHFGKAKIHNDSETFRGALSRMMV